MTRATFVLRPVPPFRLDLTVWALRRRPDNTVDRWDAQIYRRVLSLPGGPVEVAVRQIGSTEAPQLRVTVAKQPLTSVERATVVSALERLLGLRIDLSAFYEFAATRGRLGQLARAYWGMKPPRFATVFDSVVTAIAGQQITLTMAIRLLNRLAATCVVPTGEGGAAAFPCAEHLARLGIRDLQQLGFTSQRGCAVIELARSVAEGLNLEELAALPDEEVLVRLQDLRGVGRWTAEYVMLRGLGRLHVFPGDDAGARNTLQRWLNLPEPLDFGGVRRIMADWRPFGGLIYLHLVLEHLAAAGFVQTSSGAGCSLTP